MTQDKEQLLKDLCARLSCGVKVYLNTDMCSNWTGDYVLTAIKSEEHSVQCSVKHFSCWCDLKWVKPYLFPLSSMTEEQRDVIDLIASNSNTPLSDVVDFYNKNHLDYRGLIPKDLAIDATGKNIY